VHDDAGHESDELLRRDLTHGGGHPQGIAPVWRAAASDLLS
jgi:hypothetical protein